MTRDNSKNRKYTKEEKEKLIARMLPPESISPSKLSLETGISQSTLATWKTKASVSKIKGITTSNKTISSREKFLIVMKTYTMSESDLGKYCRENGLYVAEVKEWRSSCLAANDGTKIINKSLALEEQLKEEKRKAKELEKDLRRKEKALAETAALLVLRKKLDAIFGENEED